MNTQNYQLLITQEPLSPNQKQIKQQEIAKLDKQKSELKVADYVVGMGPYAQYFLKKVNKIQNLKQVQNKYGNSINFKLISQISNGNTLVSKHKRQYSIKTKIQTAYQKVQLAKQQLLKEKEQTIQRFNDLIKAETQLLKKNASIIKSQSPKHTKNIQRKPFHDKEQNQGDNESHLHEYVGYQEYLSNNEELKKALKRLKEFKKTMKQKQIQVQQFTKNIKEEDLKDYLAMIQEQRQRHRLELQKRKQQVNKIKLQQQEFKRKSKQFVHQIKPQKYKFQIVKQQQERQKQQKQRMSLQWRNRSGTNIFQEIKEHEQKYLNSINQRKQSWMNNFEENLRSYQRKRRYHSIFTERVLEEDHKKSEEQNEKQQWRNEFLDRIKSYANHVSQNHKPTVENSTHNRSEEKDKKLRHSFSRIQIRNKGLQYLKEVQEKIKQKPGYEKINTQENILKSKSQSLSLPAIKPNLPYRDYLKEMPKRNKLSANPQTFRAILDEKKDGWAQTALYMLNKLENKPKKTRKPFESAYHKIELLNAIL